MPKFLASQIKCSSPKSIMRARTKQIKCLQNFPIKIAIHRRASVQHERTASKSPKSWPPPPLLPHFFGWLTLICHPVSGAMCLSNQQPNLFHSFALFNFTHSFILMRCIPKMLARNSCAHRFVPFVYLRVCVWVFFYTFFFFKQICPNERRPCIIISDQANKSTTG